MTAAVSTALWATPGYEPRLLFNVATVVGISLDKVITNAKSGFEACPQREDISRVDAQIHSPLLSFSPTVQHSPKNCLILFGLTSTCPN